MHPTDINLPWAHWWNGHTLLGRILSRIDHRGAEGCWLWTGTIGSTGYGRFDFNHRNYYAHRLLFHLYYGQIPDGLVLDHLCRVPRCVNPEHLEPVTEQVNIVRGEGPSARAVRSGQCQRGHVFTPETTYLRPGGKRMCRTCMDARTAATAAKNKQHRLDLRVARFLSGDTLKGRHPEGFEERLRALGITP